MKSRRISLLNKNKGKPQCSTTCRAWELTNIDLARSLSPRMDRRRRLARNDPERGFWSKDWLSRAYYKIWGLMLCLCFALDVLCTLVAMSFTKETRIYYWILFIEKQYILLKHPSSRKHMAILFKYETNKHWYIYTVSTFEVHPSLTL